MSVRLCKNGKEISTASRIHPVRTSLAVSASASMLQQAERFLSLHLLLSLPLYLTHVLSVGFDTPSMSVCTGAALTKGLIGWLAEQAKILFRLGCSGGVASMLREKSVVVAIGRKGCRGQTRGVQ